MKAAMDGPGFITIKYGDNQAELFSTWCPCLVLLKTILKRCQGPDKVQEAKTRDCKLDLVDVNGELKNLTDHMTEYAYNFVDPRETYVLILIEVKEETSTYTPQINNIGKWFPKIKDKMDVLSRRQNTTTKGSRWAAIKTITKFSVMGKKSDNTSKKKDSRRSSQTGSERSESASSEMTSRKSSRTARKVKDK